MKLAHIGTISLSVVLLLALTACGFHLRETTALPDTLQQVKLEGISTGSGFGRVLKDSFTDARSNLSTRSKSNTRLVISRLSEDRRTASFDADLDVRQYMLFILFDYKIIIDGKTVASDQVKLDKTMNYDADYVLGKREEASQIRKALREDAARLILLKLKSLAV
ncbi:LPS assembly lipoprotein LptE [Leucothrix pacifica]|uniref:LPS-assembly lipoprotein LptE n=1 Tax=Leucothrix pacifica TaxID=1247513 RepID=A0A317CKL1_9GAMM|nr:LPS assembly lipoprotein LptE [Leucothrix pacifica]PWQ99124.1 hypothetical protein DKW60_06735 [Leucothrix pacifica]